MKINKILTFSVFALCFVAWSCNDYENVPTDNYTDEYIFSREDSLGVKVNQYLINIYDEITNGHERLGGAMDQYHYLDAASDDAVTSSISETEVYALSIGRYSSTTLITHEIYWKQFYRGIRRTTNVVNNIDVVPIMGVVETGKPLQGALKAEARFLRAYFYFELVKRYGGVPLMGNELYQIEDNVEFPRNSFEDCINYIVSELDAIKDDMRTLPYSDPDKSGHAPTKEAALALKCRVLLYAASPLFNGKTQEQGNSIVGYADYSAERWKRAADEAKQFIDTYCPDPDPESANNKFKLTPDFRDAFLHRYGETVNGEMGKEVFWFRQNGGRAGKGIEQRHGPVGFTGTNQGYGRTSPTQELVNAFPMKNGRPISDPASGYSTIAPYDNRDPRLNYTVLHNGSQWLNGTLETWLGGTSNPDNNTMKTKTSYYMRKFMGKFENEKEYSDVPHVWVVFRYAEILLNFAEAQNEYYGPTPEVYQAIKTLRKRAGIDGDDGTYGLDDNMTKDQMREIIRNERRIEMAFEEHRFYDIRRWKIAEDIFKKPLTGLVILKQVTGFDYNEVTVMNTPFDPKRYLHPIPYTEVIKNKNMVQNPGWK